MAKSDVLVRMKADTQNYDANIAKARRQLDQFKKDNLSMGGVLKQLSGSFVGAAAGFASITAAVGAATAAISSNIETAKNFEKSMSQLSSLTGKVGEDLNKLKEYAIDLGGSTTLTASQVADAFKMIGSQQPQLLASSEALKAVTKNAITLSEAAGIDLATAAQTLSTSINQMGGDSNNAERYINVLAAASQKGAGDIAWLGEAITKSATAAKAVGTDYEELVANLEQLAKAGFDASTAGTALRSIIMNLEKQANQDFKPSIVGLTKAFENLGKANLSITKYQEIAGKLFASQAMALANAAGEAKKMKDEITGTNIAEEQAKTNTDNLDGSLKSLSSAWEALNLHINSSNGLLKSAVDWLKDVVKWADQAFTAAGRAQKKLAELQGGGNGKQTTVDKQLSTLRGSQYKNANFNAQVSRYNRQIAGIESQLSEARYNLKNTPGTSQAYLGIINDLEAELSAVKSMRDEYKSRAKEILNPTKGTGDNKTPQPQGTDPKKTKMKAELDELQKIQKKIADLTKEAYTADDDRISAIQKEIAGLQEQEKKLISIKELVTGTSKGPDLEKLFPDASAQNYNTGYAGTAQSKYNSAIADLVQGPLNMPSIQSFISTMQSALAEADFGTPVYESITKKLRDATTMSTLLQELMERGLEGADLGNVAKTLKEKLLSPEGLDQNAVQTFIDELNRQIKEAGGVKLTMNAQTGEVTDEKGKKEDDKSFEKFSKDLNAVSSGLNSVTSGLNTLGLEIPAEFGELMNVISGVGQIISGVQAIISLTQTPAQIANTTAIGLNTAAIAGLITALEVNSALSFLPFARGGIVPHAANGYFIGGGRFSGDTTPIMANAGELVLNRAQQGVLAASLDGGSMQNLQLEARISGEDLIMAINNNSDRRGYGEYATTKNR